MANTKITGLTSNTSPLLTDILPMVDDPSGSPLTQKITIGNLFKAFPYGRIFNSANQSITTSTDTALTFDSERTDLSGMHSTSSNTSRVTIATAGFYAIVAYIDFEFVTGTYYREAYIRVNGTTKIATVSGVSQATAGPRFTVSAQYAFSAADYFEVMVYHERGSNLNILRTANISPELSWALLATS